MTQFQVVCMSILAAGCFTMALYSVTVNSSPSQFLTFFGFGVGYLGLAGVYA